MPDILRVDPVVTYEKYSLSPKPVNKIPFEQIFVETDNTQGIIFKGRRSGRIHNFTKNIGPGYQ